MRAASGDRAAIRSSVDAVNRSGESTATTKQAAAIAEDPNQQDALGQLELAHSSLDQNHSVSLERQ
jgi:hypothetical protein